MKTEQKVKNAITWIDGLKNTRVLQGIGELGDSKTGYCCLGYGCKRLGIPYNKRDEVSEEFQFNVGLKDDHGIFDGEYVGCYCSLVELNDDLKWSFRKISTFLKKRAKDVFIPEVAEGLIKHYNNKI